MSSANDGGKLKKMVLISPQLLERIGFGHKDDEKKDLEVKRVLQKKIAPDQKWAHLRSIMQNYQKRDDDRRQSYQLPIIEQMDKKPKKRQKRRTRPLVIESELEDQTPVRRSHSKPVGRSRLRPRSKLKKPIRWEALP